MGTLEEVLSKIEIRLAVDKSRVFFACVMKKTRLSESDKLAERLLTNGWREELHRSGEGKGPAWISRPY